MAILNNELQERIDELIDLAYTKNEEGDTDSSFLLLKKAWELYPEPKSDWNDAYNTAKYIYVDYLKLNMLEEAKVWLNKMIENNNNLHLEDEDVLFETGKYLFEIENYEESINKFKEVVKEAGFRYFENENPKYLEFYRNPEKYLK